VFHTLELLYVFLPGLSMTAHMYYLDAGSFTRGHVMLVTSPQSVLVN
jgi:hypothetical protein